MDKIKRIKELTEKLHKASIAYYQNDNPIYTDKQYDEMYDELEQLEKETGVVLAGSPTNKVQGFVLDGFTKVQHTKPMLSADKTKDVNEIKRFVGDKDYYCSYKLDGLTLVVRYKNGKFVQGITRGSGEIGEDVTEQCRFIKNLPMQISNEHDIELRGECVISWEEFDRINSTLEIPYSHPRNLAAGTLRNLDLNIVKERNLSFVVFELVTPTFTHKLEGLKALEDMGFECVGRCVSKNNKLEDCVEGMQPEWYSYPTDGLIFEFNNTEYSKSLGHTSHHDNCRMALKWMDDLYETTLKDIEWQTSKTGLVNPVAVFEPVDLDGAITTRATLHNINYIEDLELGIGDIIQVYRANMVIPKVHDNFTRSNTWMLPDKCPNCGGNVEVHNENGSKTLHCVNSDCSAQLHGKLVHFCSKNAINIDGMSEATLEFMIEELGIKTFKDLYQIPFYNEVYERWVETPGFGKRSVDKLRDAIEKSRNTTLERFLYAQSINLIGKTASKDIAKYCKGSIDTFCDIMANGNKREFLSIDGFGQTMMESLENWYENHWIEFLALKSEFNFESKTETNQNKTSNNNNGLNGKAFCITGKLEHHANRDELVAVIESYGGRYVTSVTSKTDYLINNDVTSTTGKNKKAKDLNIPIISEQDFLKMIGLM